MDGHDVGIVFRCLPAPASAFGEDDCAQMSRHAKPNLDDTGRPEVNKPEVKALRWSWLPQSQKLQGRSSGRPLKLAKKVGPT